MKSNAVVVRVLLASLAAGMVASASKIDDDAAISWSQAKAAQYLDSRETWWQAWPKAQRDHGTICVSCHSVLPYALARPALRQQMGEQDPAGPERTMLNNVLRRVTLWNDVEPFYKDGKSGPTKSIESRSTESVLNALILSSYDARSGHLREITDASIRQCLGVATLHRR